MGLSILRLIKATFLALVTVVAAALVGCAIFYLANTISFPFGFGFFLLVCMGILISVYYDFLS